MSSHTLLAMLFEPVNKSHIPGTTCLEVHKVISDTKERYPSYHYQLHGYGD